MGAAICDSGFKLDSITYCYVGRNTFTGVREGFGPSANNADLPSTEFICDSNSIVSATDWGHFVPGVQHISWRNERVYGGLANGYLREISTDGTAPHYFDTSHLYGCSVNKITGSFFVAQTSFWKGLTIKGCAVVLSGSQKFYDLVTTGDDANLTCDYNVYWRVGGTPDSDANFAVIGGVTKTFAQWQALGHDTHSLFRDPKFTSDNDLTPQAGSPCLHATLAMPDLPLIAWDATGTARTTNLFDAGAIQVTTSGGGGGGSGQQSFAQSNLIATEAPHQVHAVTSLPGTTSQTPSLRMFGMGL
jgi:hypothetical protein